MDCLAQTGDVSVFISVVTPVDEVETVKTLLWFCVNPLCAVGHM